MYISPSPPLLPAPKGNWPPCGPIELGRFHAKVSRSMLGSTIVGWSHTRSTHSYIYMFLFLLGLPVLTHTTFILMNVLFAHRLQDGCVFEPCAVLAKLHQASRAHDKVVHRSPLAACCLPLVACCFPPPACSSPLDHCCLLLAACGLPHAL